MSAGWQDLLRDWNFSSISHRFQEQGHTDVSLWYYFDDQELKGLGLSKSNILQFRKLIDHWVRKCWDKTSPVQIYSQSKNKWFDGVVTDTLTDTEGEWLTVRYNKTTSKQVQRFCEDIRTPPIPSPDKVKATSEKPRRNRAQSVSIDTVPGVDLKLISDLSANERLLQEQQQQQKRINNMTARETRVAWTKGEYVEVYSRSRLRWLLGSIMEVGEDEEGEFLEVHYHDKDTGQNSKKRVGRFDEEIRAVQLAGEDAGAPSAFMSNMLIEEPIIEDPETDPGDYPESAISIHFRMKELGVLRRMVLLKEGSISELQEQIKDLKALLQENVSELRECRTRLQREEARFQKQSDVIMRQSRKKWKRGSFMEVYSNSRGQWFLAECQDVFEDSEGEWLQVMFCDPVNNQTIMKQIQRFSNELRPCEIDRTPPMHAHSDAPQLTRISEIPTKETMEDQDWENFHQEEEIDIVEIPPPMNVQTNAGALNSQSDRRRTSHAISDEEEVEINQMKGEKLYIIYQSQTYEVFAHLNQPVSHLMNRIEVKLQVEPAVQELYLEDLLMDITQPLSTYCREPGATVFLKVKDKNTKRRVHHSRAARGSTNVVPEPQQLQINSIFLGGASSEI